MGTVIVLVLAGVAWFWWQQRRAAQMGRVEELTIAAQDMEQTAAELKTLHEQVAAATEQENYAEAIRICSRAIELVDEQLGGDPELLLPLLDALANFHDLADQPEQAIPALQQSTTMREGMPEQAQELMDGLARLAVLHQQRQENREAKSLRKRELELRRRHGMAAAPEMLRAQLSLLIMSLDEPAMAEPIRRDIRETARQLNHEVLGDMQDEANRALSAAIAESRDRDAWPAAEQAALLAEALHGPEHDNTFICRGNLAEILRRNRQFEAADTQFRVLISQLEKRDDGAEGLDSIYGNMALLCEESGQPEEAAAWRQRQTMLLQGSDASVGRRFNALNNLAVSHSSKGDENAAANSFAEALALSPEGEGVEPRVWAETLNNYGGTLVTLQRLPEAGRIYQKVLVQKKAGAAIPLPVVASTLNGLGMVYDHLGKLPQAQDMFERALKIKEQHLSADDKALETGRHNLGSVYMRLGNMAGAAEMAKLVLASREKRWGKDHPETQAALLNLRAVAVQLQRRKSATREEVDALLVNVTGGELRPYATFDFGRARDERVSMVLVPEGDSLSLQYKLARALPPGWRCYVGSTRWLGEEKHEGQAELVAIQSDSQFDCLRIARTDAINHSMETEDVIRRLEDYHRRFGIRIVAAATDSVEFQLLRMPEDAEAFAAELLEFCMDLEDVSLIMPMLTAPSRLVSLWWD
ncbi:MAG: tetratricopeptide repeat protein [Moraxellaceae bacterium]